MLVYFLNSSKYDGTMQSDSLSFVFYIYTRNLKLFSVFIHFLESEIAINTRCLILIRTDEKNRS